MGSRRSPSCSGMTLIFLPPCKSCRIRILRCFMAYRATNVGCCRCVCPFHSRGFKAMWSGETLCWRILCGVFVMPDLPTVLAQKRKVREEMIAQRAPGVVGVAVDPRAPQLIIFFYQRADGTRFSAVVVWRRSSRRDQAGFGICPSRRGAPSCSAQGGEVLVKRRGV